MKYGGIFMALFITACLAVSGVAVAYNRPPHWLNMTVVGAALLMCWTVLVVGWLTMWRARRR